MAIPGTITKLLSERRDEKIVEISIDPTNMLLLKCQARKLCHESERSFLSQNENIGIRDSNPQQVLWINQRSIRHTLS